MGSQASRIALVTGASRGMGLAISQVLAREGAELVLVARNRAVLRASTATLPGEHLAIAADVTRPTDVERLFAAVAKRHARLDVLVNNAGVFTFKPFGKTTLDDWRKNIDNNLTSLFLITQAALPLLKKSRSAHIVNILSVSSLQAFPNCSAYAASKFGALGFTRVLAQELRPLKIRVTGILPGATNTRMSKEFGFPVQGETLIQPEDVAECVLAALRQPARTSVDEILLTPARGDL